MTSEQYISKLKKLHEKYRDSIHDLELEYVLSQPHFNIGDIITNGYVNISIRIEEIDASDYNGHPSCVYRGYTCKKDGSPLKRGSTWYTIHHSNVLQKIKETP